MDSPTVTVIGNINIDLVIASLSGLPEWGRDTIVSSMEFRTAGAAGYTAMALSRIGVPVALVTNMGDDLFGRRMLADLQGYPGIDLQGVEVTPGVPSGLSVSLVREDGERGFITYLGHLAHLEAGLIDRHWEKVAQARILLLCGYFVLPALRGDATQLLLERSRREGLLVLLDTGWDPVGWPSSSHREIRKLLPLVDVFLPNLEEARALTGESQPSAMARRLIEEGLAQLVIKLGSQGCLAADGQSMVYEPAYPVEIFDTTGAGDAFNAAFIYGLLAEWPLTRRLRFANRLAAHVIARRAQAGERFPSLEELEA
ncbi:MAG: carbohydrate kinase family protein [Chloroflexi bacterium]|nr:carbohydrate kinase family protein [Chloroflexota bacterium]